MSNKMKWLGLTLLIVFTASCGAPSGPKSSFGGSSDTVFATVNGTPITENDVMNEIKPQMRRIETELFKLQQGGIDKLIDKKLLEGAAKKEGKGLDQYLKDYYTSNMKDPTEDEIKRYYEFRKKQMGDKKFDEVKNQIVQFLKNNQKNALERRLVRQLRTDADVDVKLEPTRIEVKIGDAPTLGKKGAPVTIVEYTDYQCPYCSRARDTVNKIVETYPEEVVYVLKDFPLSFHKNAQKAHEAAHCAGDQGKYWDMSKELFANQRALSVGDIKKYAKKIGLDTKKFDKCLTDSIHADRVKTAMKQGQAFGVTGTPAFFVNGVMISGARPFNDFQEIIDRELKRKK